MALHPEGEFQVCVEAVRVTQAKSGNLQTEIEFFVDENTKRTAYLSLTDAARTSWVDAALEKLGFNGDFGAPTISEEYYQDYCLTAYCSHDEYKGRPQEKWSLGGGKSNEPAPDDAIRRLNASWKAKHKGPAAKPAGAPKPPPPSAKKPTAPPAKKAKPFGRDEAWEAISELHEKKGAEVDVDTWQSVIDGIGDESTFGEEEWRRVVSDFPPF